MPGREGDGSHWDEAVKILFGGTDRFLLISGWVDPAGRHAATRSSLPEDEFEGLLEEMQELGGLPRGAAAGLLLKGRTEQAAAVS